MNGFQLGNWVAVKDAATKKYKLHAITKEDFANERGQFKDFFPISIELFHQQDITVTTDCYEKVHVPMKKRHMYNSAVQESGYYLKQYRGEENALAYVQNLGFAFERGSEKQYLAGNGVHIQFVHEFQNWISLSSSSNRGDSLSTLIDSKEENEFESTIFEEGAFLGEHAGYVETDDYYYR
jgi:hypothetical protein